MKPFGQPNSAQQAIQQQRKMMEEQRQRHMQQAWRQDHESRAKYGICTTLGCTAAATSINYSKCAHHSRRA